MNRKTDFEAIRQALSTSLRVSNSNALLAEGDSLTLIKSLPNHCVSLILTDPPYHSTKKRIIHGDTAFEKDLQYVEWLTTYANEWHRVLKPNGSLFCFCASAMAARLAVAFSNQFNVLAEIVWTKPNGPGFDGWKQKMKKEALRQWYPHSERIIFAEPAYGDNLFRSYFGNLLREMRAKTGLNGKELTEEIGAFGKVNHGGAVSNWEAGRNTPSPQQYAKLCEVLEKKGKVDPMPLYNDAIRPFIINSSEEFTDVWNFPSVRPYKGKHPAEKPLDMLEHAIKTTTYPGDIVLDCFAGSGNTAVAALNFGRLAVAMEIDPPWVKTISKKIKTGNIKLNIEASSAHTRARPFR